MRIKATLALGLALLVLEPATAAAQGYAAVWQLVAIAFNDCQVPTSGTSVTSNNVNANFP
ncbi:MAG: hypothetical protein ABW194_10845 [Novosphingobium sp.]